MHLSELSGVTAVPVGAPAPDWMRGAFRRRSISFANGLTDTTTRVFWLQSRRLTIDLRLPLLSQQQQHGRDDAYLADYEAWYADALWDGRQLSWDGGASFQLYNRWPEPAILQRTGNCMTEFAPSGIYVEDWRLQSDQPGPLIALELISETHLPSGRQQARKGALIICGNSAGWVLDRAQPLNAGPAKIQQRLLSASASQRQSLLDFETAIGSGNLKDGFTVTDALHIDRTGQPLITMEGFSLSPQRGYISQRLTLNGEPYERLFRVDSFEREYPFSAHTAATLEALHWYQQESATLGRYTEKVV